VLGLNIVRNEKGAWGDGFEWEANHENQGVPEVASFSPFQRVRRKDELL
jgi:hypothetical protein